MTLAVWGAQCIADQFHDLDAEKLTSTGYIQLLFSSVQMMPLLPHMIPPADEVETDTYQPFLLHAVSEILHSGFL